MITGIVQVPMDLNATMDQIELGFISEALKRSDFSKTKAAKLLGINRTTLIQKLKKHGIPLNPRQEKGKAARRITPVLSDNVCSVRRCDDPNCPRC